MPTVESTRPATVPGISVNIPTTPPPPVDDGNIGLPDRRRGVFAALSHRNYRLYFIGQLISLIGTWMQIVAQGWLVYQLTNSPLFLGLVGFASSLPSLLVMLHAGVIIDRLPKRKLLVVTQSCAMLLAFAMAALTLTGLIQPWHVIALALLNGCVNAFDAPARQAFVVDMVAREDMTSAIAMNSAQFNTARIVGPALAGVALALVGAGWCFFINGVSFLAVIAGLLMMTLPAFIPHTNRASMTAQIKEGLSYVRNSSSVLNILILVGIASLFGFTYSTLLPAFVQDVLHQGEAALGYLSAATGVGALVGVLLVAWLSARVPKGWLLTFGNFFFPIMLILFSLTRNLPLACVTLVGVGLGFMFQNTTANTLIQAQVPDDLRGRVMSLFTFTFFGLSPLGNLEAGSVAQSLGTPLAVGLSAMVVLVSAVVIAWRAPGIRRLV